jgi:hypothetical protein
MFQLSNRGSKLTEERIVTTIVHLKIKPVSPHTLTLTFTDSNYREQNKAF